jgi:predicted GNAT family acetyltransferase
VDIEITASGERSRYEISADGKPAGFTQYERRGDAIAFLHTEIDPEYGGKGLAGRLIGHALDDVREQRLAVLPYCPFVRSFIAKHTEYTDLVPADKRAEFEL